MVPFQAQGAAQAIMDAAVLGDCLTGTAPDEVPDALDRYVRSRAPAATAVQTAPRAGHDYHLPDGPEAQERNARLVALAAENRFGPHSAAWPVDVLAHG